MHTDKKLREHISALVDGELPDCERELALAALATSEGLAAWRAYQLTGDVLRSTPGGALQDGFSARLAARLAAEPGYDAAAAPADDASAVILP
jgi:sigma-E factor negative regulatory protein RseA